MWAFGSGWNKQLNCGAALVALAAELSQNISETEVAPDALVQKCFCILCTCAWLEIQAKLGVFSEQILIYSLFNLSG